MYEGMVKLIFSDSFDPLVETGARLMTDNHKLTKQASTIFNCEYDELKPDKNHVGIHLVALGDFEHYGENFNGDGFPKRACIDYHNTFVKSGRVHRNHDNKDPKKAIGIIKASAYNDPMGRIELFIHANKEKAAAELERMEKEGTIPFSMSCSVKHDRCVLPDTIVIDRERGAVNIENIREGDFVLTQQGNYKQVLKVHRNLFNGEFTELKASNCPAVTFTYNHPIFIVPYDILHDHIGRRFKFKDSSTKLDLYSDKSIVDLGDISKHIKQIDAGKVKKGDFVVFPVGAMETNNIASNLDLAFAYVSGFYLGDGSLIKCRSGRKHNGDQYITGVSFSLGADKYGTDKLIAALAVLNSTNNTVGIYPDRQRHAIQISLRDRQLAYKLLNCCGEYSGEKYLNINTFKTREEKLAFLGGYIDSDGCVDRNKGAVRIITASKRAGYSVWALLSSLGIIATLSKNKRYPTGFKSNFTHMYLINIAAYYLPLLTNYSNKVINYVNTHSLDSRMRLNSIIWQDYILSPIKSIGSFRSSRVVYNLTVQDDETYVAGGISTHNCNICNALRKSSADANQCSHIRDHLGEVFADGKVACTHNDEPNFFEISFVRKPADRIAWDLKKIATGAVVSSVELAHTYGIVLPPHLVELTKSTMAKFAMCRKLADMEHFYLTLEKRGSLSSSERRLSELRKAAISKVEDAEINELRNYAHKDVFNALANSGIVLDPTSFFKYAFGVDYGELKESMSEILTEIRKGVFDNLVKSGGYTTAASSNYFDVDTSRVNGYICDNIKLNNFITRNLADKLAMIGSATDKRVIEATISGTRLDPVISIEKRAQSSNDSVKAAANVYAAYKLSALCDIMNNGREIDSDTLIALAAFQHLT